MDIRRYVSLVWKWAWLVVLGAAVAGGTAWLTTRNEVPIYRASSTLRINMSGIQGSNEYTALMTSERLAQTYTQLLKKEQVLDGVAQNLGLGSSGAWLGGAVQIGSVEGTDLIEVVVTHPDPAAAQAIANEIPKVFASQEEILQVSRYAALKESLAQEMAAGEDRIRQIQESIAARQAAGVPETDSELVLLQSDLQQARSSYNIMLQSYGQVLLAEVQSGNNVTVAVPARMPQYPMGSSRMRNVLLATVAGALCMAGIAYLLEILDDTLKSPEDVDRATHLATLGAISRIPGEGPRDRPVAAVHPKSHVSEAYRVLRTNLQFSSLDKPLRSLVVTSPGPTEGKSTTVANLGVVMAQAGKSVILVDADLRRPVLHRIFGLENRQGLTDLLMEDKADLNGHLRETGVENLRLLTSGALPPNPSEVLGLARMRALVERLQKEADVVLFDSPPSLAVADASVLANQTDGVLIVADSGRTRRSLAEKGVEGLRQVGANLVGVVLNRLHAGGSGYGYYYYYYGEHEPHGKKGLRSRLRRLGRRFGRKPPGTGSEGM